MTDQVRDPQAPPKQGQAPTRTIELTASLTADGRVRVTGAGDADLLRNSGDHRFEFELDDKTGLNVRFKQLNDGMLDVLDNSDACPPPTGMNTTQIVGVTRPSNTRAGFTDKNDNKNGPMPVCYQFHFECNDSTKHPIRYDPVIINGGSD